MTAFDVITYGGGENYRDIFIAVALMTGTGAMASLVRLGLLIGLVLGLLRMVTDLNPGRTVKWFIICAMIYGGLFIPKVTVHIVDKYNPGLSGADVANVPLGVGFAEATASQIGAHMIDMTETAFSDPADVEYSKTGMIYGAKFMEAATRLQFQDQVFSQNLDAFFKNCVWYDLQDNAYTADDLAKASDLWNFFAAHPPNPARSTPIISGAGAAGVSLVTCPSALSTLDGQKDDQGTSAAAVMERRLNPSMDPTLLVSSALSQMGALISLTNVASTDATRSLVQTATLNQLKASLTGSSSETGAGSALAQAQAQLQTANTGSLLGRVGENAIVVLKIVIDALFVGMFPILFPCFLLPQIGLKMLQGYVAGFFYLQLWGPMYVIVHKIIMTASYAQTGAAAMLPGVPNGFNLQTLDGINGVNANIQTVAGMMVLMVPVLAAALTRGAMAVGSQGEALLQPFRSGAEAASAALTTGNFSLGNSTVDTHAYNNVTADRVQTSGYVDEGFFTARNRSGDEVTSRLIDGAMTGVRAAPSDAAVSIERLNERATNLSERARNAAERSQTFDRVESEALSESRQQIHEAAFSRSTGSERRTGVSNEERDAHSTAASYITNIRDEAQRRFGVSFDFAASATQQATRGVQESLGLASGIGTTNLGVSHRTELQAGQNRRAEEGNSRKEDEAAAWIRQQTQSSDFKTSIDKSTTASLNRSYAALASDSHSVSDKSAGTFSSTQNFADTSRTARSESTSIEHSAEQSQRTAEVLRGQHAAAFVTFAGQHLRLTPDGFQRSNEEIGRILQGRSHADRELLYEAADTFSARYLPSNEEPGQIKSARDTLGEASGTGTSGEGGLRTAALEEAPRGDRKALSARYGGSDPAADDIAAVEARATKLGLLEPSARRDIAPDPALAEAQATLARDVDQHLGRRPKRIVKEEP